MLAGAAFVLFIVSLFLPGAHANPLGAWGRVETYSTGWVLFFRTYVLSMTTLAGNPGGLLGIAFSAGTLCLFTLPYAVALNRGPLPRFYPLLSVCLLSAWLFPLLRGGGDDRAGFYIVAVAYTVAFAAIQLPVQRDGRRYAHLGREFCAFCGYDLRASEGRCPECGGEIPERVSSLYSVLKRGRQVARKDQYALTSSSIPRSSLCPFQSS
jgi:hypothetical protein